MDDIAFLLWRVEHLEGHLWTTVLLELGVARENRFNQESWDLGKGGNGGVESDYGCVKTCFESGEIDYMSRDFYVDFDFVL